MNQKFSSHYRLCTRDDFAGMKSGKRISFHGLRCVYKKNNFNHGRIGFAVSRKYGNAVQRHKFKRLWREIYRCHAVKLASIDILIIPMKSFRKECDIQENALLLLANLMQKGLLSA